MSKLYAGAMMTIMALCVFGVVVPLGAVAPDVAVVPYLLIGLLTILWAGGLVFSKEFTWTPSPMHWPVALFALYAFARYAASPYLKSPFYEYDGRLELFQIGASVLVYFCCATYFHRLSHRNLFLVVLLLLALFQAGYGIWQVATKAETVLVWDRPEVYKGRASGTFIYPNHMAGFLEMALGWALAYAIAARRGSLSVERWVLLKVMTIYTALMIVVGIVLSWSRGGWLAASAGLAAFALLGQSRRHRGWRSAALVALVFATVGILAVKSNLISDRLLDTFEPADPKGALAVGDRTLGGRTLMWQGTLQIIRDHPILGTGVGSWQWVFQRYKKADFALLSRPDYAHNDFLNLASDYGLIGFALVVWVFVAFFRQAGALRGADDAPEKQTFALGAMVGVISLLVHCAFDFVLHIPANTVVLAALMGLTAAMDLPGRRFERRPFGSARHLVAAGALALCAWGLWLFVPTAFAYRQSDLGDGYKEDLEYETALRYYENAELMDPRFPEPPARSGDVYRTMATWRLGLEKQAERRQLALKAVEAYDRSLRLNPAQSFVLIDRGRMLEAAGDNAEAVKSFERAIEVYPSNAFAYFAFGCFLRDHGDIARAKQMFDRSGQINATPSAGLNSWEIQNMPPTNQAPRP